MAKEAPENSSTFRARGLFGHPALQTMGASPNRGGHVGWFEILSREAFVSTWPVRSAVAFLRA